MNINELKRVVNLYNHAKRKYQKLDLLMEKQSSKVDKQEYYKASQNYQTALKDMQKITGMKNPEEYFYVTLDTLKKRVEPYFKAHHLDLIGHTISTRDDKSIEIRAVIPTKKFGSLYYRLATFVFEGDLPAKKDLSNFKIYLEPFFDKTKWNNMLTEHRDFEDVLWLALKDQLLADKRFDKLMAVDADNYLIKPKSPV